MLGVMEGRKEGGEFKGEQRHLKFNQEKLGGGVLFLDFLQRSRLLPTPPPP